MQYIQVHVINYKSIYGHEVMREFYSLKNHSLYLVATPQIHQFKHWHHLNIHHKFLLSLLTCWLLLNANDQRQEAEVEIPEH